MKTRIGLKDTIVLAALFVSLGGVAYAAISVPAKSVGTKTLKRNAVVSAKVLDGSLRAVDLKKDRVESDRLATEEMGPTGPTGATGPTGNPGSFGVTGASGIVGQRGAPGEPGEPGPDGEEGPDGIEGQEGERGEAGADGADAAKGIVFSAAGYVRNLDQVMAISGISAPGVRKDVEMILAQNEPMKVSNFQAVFEVAPGGTQHRQAERHFSLTLNGASTVIGCKIVFKETSCGQKQALMTLPAGTKKLSIDARHGRYHVREGHAMVSFILTPMGSG